MKKRVLLVLGLTVLFITGCGSKNINIDKAYDNLKDEYKDFVKVDEETLTGAYGLDLDNFKSYLVVMDEDNSTALMYAVFEAKDDTDDAMYEVEYFASNYKESWTNGYFKEEEALVKKGTVEAYGNYIIYVVNDDVDKIIEMIKKS